MDVCNIKYHFYVRKKYIQTFNRSLQSCELIKKTFSSFCILRIGKFVYTCFYSGYINITGVLNFEIKPIAQKVLLEILKLNIKRTKIFRKSVIDNITAKIANPIRQPVNLLLIKQKIVINNEIITVKYDRQRFPNMFIKTIFGTIIWSPNNLTSSVGSKCYKDLKNIHQIILKIK